MICLDVHRTTAEKISSKFLQAKDEILSGVLDKAYEKIASLGEESEDSNIRETDDKIKDSVLILKSALMSYLNSSFQPVVKKIQTKSTGIKWVSFFNSFL